MARIEKVAFIGATGMLGKPVAAKLAGSGFKVTASVRDLEKAKKVLPENISLVQGDLRDIDSLKKVIEKADAVYLNVAVAPNEKNANFHPESDGIRNVIAVIKEYGNKRLCYLSSILQNYETSWWAIQIKKEAVDIIKNSGVTYTIFYPSTFMETLLVSIQGSKLMIAGTPKYKNYWIAADDYASQVAKVLKDASDANEEYFIQGLEALTFIEAGQKFINSYQRKSLKLSKAPIQMLKFIGVFVPKVSYAANIINSINNYPETFQAEETWKALGKPSITIEQFAKQQS